MAVSDENGSISLNSSNGETSKSPYWIVVDGGSTGSRLYIFEFTKEGDSVDSQWEDRINLGDINLSSEVENDMSCLRRGTIRIDMPLSGFARTPDQIAQNIQLEPSHVAQHLVPLFDFAASIIPPEYHSSTQIKYQATAGMRLVEEEEQEHVYDAMYIGLMESVLESTGAYFPFTSMERDDIGTLSGELEGFYGVVAANYLGNAIDVRLQWKDNHSDLGALDMGGSSTQLVFMRNSPQTDTLDIDDFFSTSYLSYGVEKFQERLWDTWINDRQGDRSDIEDKVIQNPCAFKGYSLNWNGYSFVGTGDVNTCSKQVRRLLSSLENPLDSNGISDHGNRIIGGIQNPPIRGKFYAMSLYFFALDAMRHISADEVLNAAWPNPTLNELYDALHGFCGRSWEGDLENIKHNSHKYTNADILPQRCFEATYMVTLLKYGFVFDASARDITYAYDVDESEVEWSLGMVLSLFAQEHKQADIRSDEPEESRKNITYKDNSPLEEDTIRLMENEIPSHAHSFILEHSAM